MTTICFIFLFLFFIGMVIFVPYLNWFDQHVLVDWPFNDRILVIKTTVHWGWNLRQMSCVLAGLYCDKVLIVGLNCWKSKSAPKNHTFFNYEIFWFNYQNQNVCNVIIKCLTTFKILFPSKHKTWNYIYGGMNALYYIFHNKWHKKENISCEHDDKRF